MVTGFFREYWWVYEHRFYESEKQKAKHKVRIWISQWKIKPENSEEWSGEEFIRYNKCILSPSDWGAHTRAERESEYRTGKENTGCIDSMSIYWALTIYQAIC